MKKRMLVGIILAAGTSVAFAKPLKPLTLGFSAPTVDGWENVLDAKPGEIVFDGSRSGFYGNYSLTATPDWRAMDRSAGIPYLTEWVTESSPTITGTGSNPTVGTGAGYSQSVKWRRVGDSMEITWNVVGGAGGSAGSGTYLFTIPNSQSADTSKMATATDGTSVVGSGALSGLPNAANNLATVVLYDSTHMAMMLDTGTNTMAFAGATGLSFAGTPTFTFRATIPISGWGATN